MSKAAKLGRCPRCKQHALVADISGLRLAVDIAPALPVAFGNALAGGVGLWWVQNEPGRGSRVLRPYSAGQEIPWGSGGLQEGAQRLHTEHSCGAPARDMVILSVTGPKGSAPATPGAKVAGSRPAPALAGATPSGTLADRSPAPSTSHHRFKPPRCGICEKVITSSPGTYWGFEHPPGVWVYAEHEECP